MTVVDKAGTPSLSTVTPDHSCQVGSGLIAGEDIAAGDVCYIAAAGTVLRSNGTSDNAAAVADGIAARESASGEAVTLFTNIEMHYGSGLTPGARYYVAATAGALDDAASTGGTVAVAKAVDATWIRFTANR